VIAKSRIRALQAEVMKAKAKGKPHLAYETLKARHESGQIKLTYQDLEWLAYLLEYKYGWATVKAFELGIFTHQTPVIVPKP
jgi:hypothetical protein